MKIRKTWHSGPSNEEITEAIAARAPCDWCGKQHPENYWHANQCQHREAGAFCRERAEVRGGRPGVWCAAHYPANAPAMAGEAVRPDSTIFDRAARIDLGGDSGNTYTRREVQS